MKKRPAQQGLSLIEVLVALVVLTIGLLGIAGLQMATTQSNYMALQYSTAARLAENLIEQMRANRVGLLENAYELAPGAVPGAPAVDCAAESCRPGELALWQLATWYSMLADWPEAPETVQISLAGALPGARAAVQCVAPCDDAAMRMVTVFWDANRSGATGLGCNPASTADLQCIRLAISP